MDTTFLDRQLSDFVSLLGMALRAGYSLRQAMEAITPRAAGRKRVEAFRAFYQQVAREFNGDDL